MLTFAQDEYGGSVEAEENEDTGHGFFMFLVLGGIIYLVHECSKYRDGVKWKKNNNPETIKKNQEAIKYQEELKKLHGIGGLEYRLERLLEIKRQEDLKKLQEILKNHMK